MTLALAWIATGAATLFAGGALYVSLVEHPARLATGPPMAVAQFRASYPRGAKLQGGLAALGTHAWLRWRSGAAVAGIPLEQHPGYRAIVIWCLLSPLVWTLPGMPDFMLLTLLANGAQVVLVPFLAGGLWWITASPRYIGPRYRTRWWENAVMAILFALALGAAVSSVRALASWAG